MALLFWNVELMYLIIFIIHFYRFAWGHDHLRPDTQSFDNDLFGLGATLVDSLTSLHIMGFDVEFTEAKVYMGFRVSLHTLVTL